MLLYVPGLAPFVMQAGIVPGTGPAWFIPVVPLGVLGLAAASYIVSRGQRSFLVAGLLGVSGILLMVPSLIATRYLAMIVLPGPILGVIIGLGIFGLGVAKAVKTARSAMVIAVKPTSFFYFTYFIEHL